MNRALILIIACAMFSVNSIFADSEIPPNDIIVHTDKKAYLPDQTILIHGQAEPDEALDVEISRRAGANVQTEIIQYLHLKSNSSGSFDGMIPLPSSVYAAQYVVKMTGSKHDEMTEKYIVITSLDDLRTRTIDVSPQQQLAMGILPDDIVCHRVWNLVLKPNGNTTVCLEPPTAVKLSERGWTIIH